MGHALARALVVVAVMAAPAAADVHDAYLARAHDVAMWRWPFVCQPITYDDIHRPVPGDWYGLASRRGTPCVVYLRADWRTWDYEFLCDIVVHEVGHLAGRGHSHNVRSIMYPYSASTGLFKPCRPGWPFR